MQLKLYIYHFSYLLKLLIPKQNLFEYEQFKASCSKSFSQMCTDQSETISYIAKIADGISKSAVDTDKNSNTEIIEKSKTASCTLLKAINAASKLSDGTEPCDVSSC